MRKTMRYLFAVTGLVALVTTGIGFDASALEVPPKPLTSPVVDQTHTLTTDQITTLDQKIASERSSSGNQIAVLMVPSLQGEPIENYSIKVARSWGVGQKERDSGVLLLVAKNDRQVRIEVGYGLEGALPDIRASHIIRDRMTPSFKQGNYFAGIDGGVDGIVAAIHGEADPSAGKDPATSSISGEMAGNFIFFGVFGLMWLGSILSRSKSWWAGGVVGFIAGIIVSVLFGFMMTGLASIVGLTLLGLLFDRTVSRNYATRTATGASPSWWAGGGGFRGGSSRGGGGFGGFGGGGFGGGGASGRW